MYCVVGEGTNFVCSTNKQKNTKMTGESSVRIAFFLKRTNKNEKRETETRFFNIILLKDLKNKLKLIIFMEFYFKKEKK